VVEAAPHPESPPLGPGAADFQLFAAPPAGAGTGAPFLTATSPLGPTVTATLFGNNTATHRKSPGWNLSSSNVLFPLPSPPTGTSGSWSSNNRGATPVDIDPGSPRISRE
jgi:hypothetical protein